MLWQVAAGALAAGLPGAEDDKFSFDPSLVEPWKESEVAIPAYPQTRDLLPVARNARDTNKLYVDRTSVAVGADGVARFSVVLESASGARNVLFEGMRCDTREYKTYAIGTSADRFQAVQRPQWRPIPPHEVNAFRRDLYRNHVCGDHSVRSAGDIVRSLASGSASDSPDY